VQVHHKKGKHHYSHNVTVAPTFCSLQNTPEGVSHDLHTAAAAAAAATPLKRLWSLRSLHFKPFNTQNFQFKWHGYKISGLNFFSVPVNLATASGVWFWLVLSPPLTVTISRLCGKQSGSSLCLKWVVFLFSVRIVLSVNVEQSK